MAGEQTDFGTDLDLVDDLPPRDQPLVNGPRNLGNAIVRRLSTDAGTLIGAPDYGLDVRKALSQAMTPRQLASFVIDVGAEVEKETRVLSAGVSYTVIAADQLQLDIEVDTADGPFTLVLLVDAVTVQLLRIE